jgi:transcriptional regulator with XRE-family HTH domain
MSYVIEQILQSLREARVRKGLSQRELSAHSGVPQSHISKIESGGVDLRMSSLIALARVLDLELFAAPKKSVPAIKSIIRSSQGLSDEDEQMSPAYQLDGDDDD